MFREYLTERTQFIFLNNYLRDNAYFLLKKVEKDRDVSRTILRILYSRGIFQHFSVMQDTLIF